MGTRKKFSAAEQELLRANPYTEKVTENQISFTLAFKEAFWRLSVEGCTGNMALRKLGYDPDFLTFEPPIRAMQTAHGITRVTRELVERLESEGLIYAELRFAPQYHLQKGLTQEDVVLAALEGLKQGLASCHTLRAGLILCAMNHCDPASNHEENMQTVRLAKKYLNCTPGSGQGKDP